MRITFGVDCLISLSLYGMALRTVLQAGHIKKLFYESLRCAILLFCRQLLVTREDPNVNELSESHRLASLKYAVANAPPDLELMKIFRLSQDRKDVAAAKVANGIAMEPTAASNNVDDDDDADGETGILLAATLLDVEFTVFPVAAAAANDTGDISRFGVINCFYDRDSRRSNDRDINVTAKRAPYC